MADFYPELKRRVERYFEDSGLSPQDDPRMRLKIWVITAWFVFSYVGLVFWASTPLAVTLFCISLAWAMGGVGFSIAHDGNHGAVSRQARNNRLAGWGYDAIGASSYFWRWKHNRIHHQSPNRVGVDQDIGKEPLFRFAATQRHRAAHRYQAIYVWPLYVWLTIQWQFYADFAFWARGRIGATPVPRPRGGELAVFLAGKVLFVAWAVALPLWRHPVGPWLASFLGVSWILSLTMSVVFQAAHCVEEADFFEADVGASEWAVRQVHATTDFARGSRFLTWYVGGLNFQIEHHLFPGVCHVHYPALAPIIEQTCGEYGVRYTARSSLSAALVSHVKLLWRLGKRPLSA